ncbi:50S ribosomal protein L16 [candidate division WOR-3 bacterium]|nr:50S ribosomal protein L16 [candidate division WOR-3 bacterium]
MLEPKKTKYRKQHRGRRKGKATSGNFIAFGEYGLVALEPAWVTARQIEASRVAIAHQMKKGGKLWVRIFPDKPVTKKPAETRMGKGKGAPEFWVSVVKPGRIIFELEGMTAADAQHLLRLAANKLPMKTRFVKREVGIRYEGF